MLLQNGVNIHLYFVCIVIVSVIIFAGVLIFSLYVLSTFTLSV